MEQLKTLTDGQEEFTDPIFIAYQKIPRLSRDVIITEKIDGSNAQILVPENPKEPPMAGSRTRWLFPGKGRDNFGFAAWVKEHEEELRQMGPGRYYGEWFGAGINRGYGLKEKRFVLFHQHADPLVIPACTAGLVPILYTGPFDTRTVEGVLAILKMNGSRLVPGFTEPEGIVVYHTASRNLYKKTILNDEKPKEINNE